jgi:hypothetical protein
VHPFIPRQQYSQEDNQRILKLYEPLRVAEVSDGMDVAGLQDIGIVEQSIHGLWRGAEDFKHRIAGIAVHARYLPMTESQIGEEHSRAISENKNMVNFEAYTWFDSDGDAHARYAIEDRERVRQVYGDFRLGASSNDMKGRMEARRSIGCMPIDIEE